MTTFNKLSRTDIFINGMHMDDIINEHQVVLAYGKSTKHPEYDTHQYHLMARNGTRHSPMNSNLPGWLEVKEQNGQYTVIKEAFYDHGQLHRVDGPALMEYHHNGSPSHCEYHLNGKRINKANQYIKDLWHPTQEELFALILGNM